MAKQTVTFGTPPTGVGGDSYKTAFGKCNENFTELYDTTASLTSAKLDATANAVSATKLQNARTLNGVAFDGTASVTIPVPIYSVTTSSDLNTYTIPGFYACPASATAAGLTNCPTAQAFSLLVEKHAGVRQTITEYTTSGFKIFVRNMYSNSWGAWIRIYTTSDAPTSVSGNAGTATKLANARTVTVGRTGKTFDGSADVSFSAIEVLPSATSGQFLKFDGTNWVAAADNNTTYSAMAAAEATTGTATTARVITAAVLKGAIQTHAPTPPVFGTNVAGLVPAPAGSTTNRYLREDGTWTVPPDTDTNTTYNVMTQAEAEAGVATEGRVVTPDVIKAAVVKHAPLGGQFLGSQAVKAIAYNAQAITENVTIPGDVNALSAGPITISDGFTVEISDGATWTIV